MPLARRSEPRHSDFRVDNLVFDGTAVVVIDWQSVATGQGLYDWPIWPPVKEAGTNRQVARAAPLRLRGLLVNDRRTRVGEGEPAGHVQPDDVLAGGYPIQVLTSGAIAGFEAIADAISAQTGGAHVVVPGTNHAVQNQADPVNGLLEQFCLAGGVGNGR